MSNNIYCTYLTIYKGNKLPPLYIGSTSIKNIEEGYHGSVSSKKYKEIWLSELSENPHLFETKILTTHETREEAFDEEVRYQIEHDVIRSQQYINMAVANKKLMFIGNDLERNRKISEALTGIKRTAETKKKVSEARKKYYESEENRKKTSETSKKQFETEEARKNASEISKRLWESKEYRKKQSDRWTEEARKNMSQFSKDMWESEEHKKKISESQKGKKKSEEARKNMSIAQKKRYENPEERKKSSKSAKNRKGKT